MKAFPTTAQTWDIHNGRDLTGMDLRDYFAAHAMLKMTWNKGDDDIDAVDCYKIADAMMKARQESSQNDTK